LAGNTRSSGQILAGDIGGTKTLLGLYEPAAPRPHAVAVQRFATSAHPSLEAMVATFLASVPHTPLASATFGVAGPVADGRAQLTNHSWSLDAAALATTLGTPVHLLNDLEAMAYALDALDDGELSTLQAGQPLPRGPRAILAAGTGLGVAYVVQAGGHAVACPTEGGHADFAPRNPREDDLVRRLRRQYGRASVEHVLSGPGLVRLHGLTHDDAPCPAVVSADASDQPAAITASALGGLCPRCHEALSIFVSAYGSEAGNLALRTLPTGGLFVGGGIVLAIEGALRGAGFREAFLDKPPMRQLLEGIPVHLVLARDAGLLGAAVVAQRHRG
jgi:glucokinase